MAGRECFHCRQWIAEGEAHDCWTTTEEALTRDLSEDLREAWERLRDTAIEFGEQRVYASHSSIMFARQACYFFVRPKSTFLEVWFFLGRSLNGPPIRKVLASSRVKVAHLVQVRHRDEVEAPLTEWLREAYDKSDALTAAGRAAGRKTAARKKAKPGRVSAKTHTKAGTKRTRAVTKKPVATGSRRRQTPRTRSRSPK
jgi:hypothetical protein